MAYKTNSMNIKKHFLNRVAFLIAFIILLTGFIFVNAFTSPSQPPPGGNVEVPINTSAAPQVKQGDLTLANNLIVQGVADIVGWAHTNVVSSLNADQVDSYSAADLLAQVAASPFPVWVIKTTSPPGNSGSLGGREGANLKCREEFGERAMMFGTQHVNCYSMGTCALDFRIAPSVYSWFDYTTNNFINGYYFPQNWSHSGNNCKGWTSGSGLFSGGTIRGNGEFSAQSCNHMQVIACAILQ